MVYVLMADGFEETEATEPIDIMRRAGLEVRTASISSSKEVLGAHGIRVGCDMLSTDINPEDMDLLMLPGGPGHELLDASNDAHFLINECVVRNKYLAAICAAPSILGKKMILDGKRAACFPGYERYLYGAKLTNDKAVRDGNIITARGAGAAGEFGFEIVAALCGREKADTIKEQMQF